MAQQEQALVVLRGEESKVFIGRAVARLPQVQAAARAGRMAIVGGTTTRYVVQALLGEDPGLESFAVGWIHEGVLGETPSAGRGPGAYLFDAGQISRGWPGPLLERFRQGDVYIKGANAVDPQGNAGILLGSPQAGTIGAALPILMARGARLIIPVSLQKLIPSIGAVGGLMGQGGINRVMGTVVGYMPIMAGFAQVITEVEAMRLLYNLEATPVAKGGSGDSADAVTLHLSGGETEVVQAWQDILALRNGA